MQNFANDAEKRSDPEMTSQLNPATAASWPDVISIPVAFFPLTDHPFDDGKLPSGTCLSHLLRLIAGLRFDHRNRS
jgi:hypothetical protein